MIGGTDPAKLARDVPDRIAHTHLKDVNAGLAGSVRAGTIAVLGRRADGHVPAARHGRRGHREDHPVAGGRRLPGWYVLEQDTVLTGDAGRGPLADVLASVAFVTRIAETLA